MEYSAWGAQGRGARRGECSVGCSGPRHAPWGCPCLPPTYPPEHVSIWNESYLTNSNRESFPGDPAGVDFALADMPVLCPTQAVTGAGTRTGAPAASAVGTEPSQPTTAPSVEAVGLPGSPRLPPAPFSQLQLWETLWELLSVSPPCPRATVHWGTAPGAPSSQVCWAIRDSSVVRAAPPPQPLAFIFPA